MKPDNRKAIRLFCLLGIIPVVWFALLMAPSVSGGLPQIIDTEAMAKINVSELLALNIYSTYNISKNYHGVAQAKAVIFFILVAVLALTQQWATSRKEVQQ